MFPIRDSKKVQPGGHNCPLRKAITRTAAARKNIEFSIDSGNNSAATCWFILLYKTTLLIMKHLPKDIR